jgi:(5-formylfuran-3-yl)methyl phosphate synthase
MKLLVSVRDRVEAEVVASCDVHVVDLKEPLAGSLGQASQETAKSVAAAIHGRAILSAAMGELVDYQSHDLDYLQHYDFVKVGLSRIQEMDSLRARWIRWTSESDIKRRAVVVAYADFRQSQSLEPSKLAKFAVEVAAPYFLIDTWIKSKGNLLDWISIDALQELAQQLSANNVGVVLAGSLDVHSISRLRELPVALIAVRGAVCVGGQRNGPIDPQRIRSLLELVTKNAIAD